MSASEVSKRPNLISLGSEGANLAASPAASLAIHPEEMKASVDLRIGRSFSMQATARATPAGLVAVGVMTAAVVLSVAGLVKARRRRAA